jgi:NIMA (never in mitosis gene a)-related kinase
MRSLAPKGANATKGAGSAGRSARYATVKILGRGAFGTAYIVRRKADSFLYVMKKLALEQLGEKEKAEAMNECKVLGQLRNHPNIVKVLEHFVDDNRLCIVMEYADGGDLAQRIEHQATAADSFFPEEQVLDWFVQVDGRLSTFRAAPRRPLAQAARGAMRW